MSPLVYVTILAAAVAAVGGLLFVVRARAPAGGLMVDTTRANALYTMVATAFAVLLAFVVLVAFQSFNEGRSGAESEAEAVLELFRATEFFPPRHGRALQGEMVCYARAVVEEWPRMREGGRSQVVDLWVRRIQDGLSDLPIGSPVTQEAFASILAEEDERSRGRRERLAEGTPVVSTPVWLALGVGALVVVLTALLFAARQERFLVQASLMSAVTMVVVSGLVLIWFLDHPYEDAAGSIKPIEMQRSIEIMREERPAVPRPCDSSGAPRPA